MTNSKFRTIWKIPLLLAFSIVFGLLSALLGTGIWHLLSWVTMSIPLIILLAKIFFTGKRRAGFTTTQDR